MRHTTLVAALALALMPLGCSDDSTETTDQGTPHHDVLAGQEGGTVTDGTTQSDSTVNQVCDPTCQAESRTKCVKDTATGDCLECTTNEHCLAMPDVDGPWCNTSTNRCVECLENADCANHPGGAVCDGNSCICNEDSDCSGGARFGPKCVQLISYSRCGCESDDVCSGTTLGSKCFADLNHKCVCYEQADCAGNGGMTSCQLPYYYSDYGHCATPCTTDAECKLERLERCDLTTGACVECTEDAQCGDVERGHKCLSNRCSCESNTDCPEGTECADLMGTVGCYEP